MTLRTLIGRALHAMTTTGAPQAWEDDPGTITTAQAATALGLMADPSVAAMAARADNREVRLERDAAQAELEDTRRQLRLAMAAVARLDAAGEAVERRNAALTRDVALRTTQRDKARTSLDRALAELEALRAEVDAVVRAWMVPGSHPEYHQAQVDRLQVQWLSLHTALVALAARCPC